MRSFFIRVAQLGVTLILGIAILAGIGAWRLSQGPVSLNFLTPALERSFAFNETPFAVQVDDTSLVWGGWKRVADLRVRNLRLFGPDGKIVALLPDVSVGLSFRGLIQGEIAVSRLDVIGLRASFERFPDGRFGLQLPLDKEEGGGADKDLAAMADEFLRPMRERRGFFRHLRRFSILEGGVRFIDRMSGQVWVIPRADLASLFGEDGIETKLALSVAADGQRTNLAVTLLHDRKSGRIGGRVDFNRLRPATIARALPQLAQIAAIRSPLSGDVNFEVASGWRLLGMRLRLAGAFGRAALAMRYPQSGGAIQVAARLDRIRLAALARATPALASLAGFDVSVSGVIEGAAVSPESFHVSRLRLASGAGAVELPGLFPRPLKVSAMRVHADLAEDLSSGEIKEFAVDFGKTRVTATGKVSRQGDGYRVRADAALANLAMDDLESYWPLGIGESVRRWVTKNITQGTVSEGKVSVAFAIPRESDRTALLESIGGTLNYRGLAIEYWAPLPRVVDVGGTATFTESAFDFAVSGGRLRDVAVERALVKIGGLDTEDQDIAIDVALRGSAKTLAHVIDRKPLRHISKLGLSPDAVAGEAVVRAEFRFPLLDDLKPESVRASVSAALGKLSLSPGPFGLAVDRGDVILRVDNAKLSASGTMRLFSQPATIDWSEVFDGTSADAGEPRRQLVIAGRVPDLGSLGFGLPDIDAIRGPADANLVLTQRASGAGELLANVELADASLSVPGIGWTKPAGVPGTANLAFSFDGAGLKAIDKLSVEAGDVELLGHARPRGGDIEGWRVTVERFENAGSDVSGTIDLAPDGALSAKVTGKRFDVGLLLDREEDGDGLKKPSAIPRARIDARFGELSWGPERRLRNANLILRKQGDVVQGLMLDGRLGRRGSLEVKFLPGPDGQVLRIAADDFGELLSASPSSSRVKGGTFLVRGLRPSPDAPVSGDFIASGFTLSKAPALARLLQVASLTGIFNALSEKGLRFDAFEGQFRYRDGRVTFTNASAHGSSIGVTVNGAVDFERGKTNLGGTLVPAYSLNRVIGRIPLIGSLLTGGKNEGLFAATYRVTGPLEDPKVSVNPLSALAPGFLRNLFGLGSVKPEDRDALPPAPPDPGESEPG